MGTDIHLLVEKRNQGAPLTGDYRYSYAPAPGDWGMVRGCDRDGLKDAIRRVLEAETPDSAEYWRERALEYKDTKFFLYGDRNYGLFSILADVRNGSGFAGCDTGDWVAPIDEPRGLPDDVGCETRDVLDDVDYHSQSWLSLRDLLEYGWSEQRILRGFVNLNDYEKWRLAGSAGPPLGSYCGGVYGPKTLSWSELKQRGFPDPETLKRKKIGYVQLEWSMARAVTAYNFYTDSLPELIGLATGTDGSAIREGDPLPPIDPELAEDVRIVFAFDN